MSTTEKDPSSCRPEASWSLLHTCSLLAIVVLIGLSAWFIPQWGHIGDSQRISDTDAGQGRFVAWLVNLALFGLFAVIAGHGATGLWRGLFVDPRNQISLSRLQMACWTVVVLSGWITAVLSNLAFTQDLNSMNVAVPPELWAALGISTISLIGSPLIQSAKKDKTPDPAERQSTFRQLTDNNVRGMVNIDPPDGVLLYKQCPSDSQFSDMFRGEETGNGSYLDLGQVQMFFFTLVLVLGYSVAIGVSLHHFGAGLIDTMPHLSQGFVVLLGISHAGYLTNKAVPHSREGAATGSAVTTASLAPMAGPAGSPVTLTGSGFGTSQGESRVTIDGVSVRQSVLNWGDGAIQFVVPDQHPNGADWTAPQQQVAVGLNGTALATADGTGSLPFVVTVPMTSAPLSNGTVPIQKLTPVPAQATDNGQDKPLVAAAGAG